MTKQKTVTLNLTMQEAECLSEVFKLFTSNYHFNYPETRPIRPFMRRLQEKINGNSQPIKRNPSKKQ